jgi:D-methionine transport system substrate-binding protein
VEVGKMKKLLLTIMVLVVAVIAAGCGNNESEGSEQTLKVGVSSGDTRTWEYIVELAKEEGVNIELVKFNDYIQPNLALAEGEIDANAFQTISYFDEFIQDQKLDLVPIGSTVIAPMGIYSNKYKKLEDLPENATIAIPNEGTNMGRGLLLLQEAGLLTLEEGFDGVGALDKIVSNPTNIKFELVAAGNTPRFLEDVDASIINNNFAIEAGLSLEDALFHESATAKPYINIIAVQAGDEDRPELQKLVEFFHSQEVEEFIKETYKGSQIPAFVSLEELVNYKDAWTNPAQAE